MMFNILCIINTIVSLGIIIIDCWISANDKSQLKVVGVYLSISILSFMFGGCLLIVNSVKKDIHIYASMIGFVISFIMILLYISSFLTLNYSFTLFNYLNIASCSALLIIWITLNIICIYRFFYREKRWPAVEAQASNELFN